MNWFRKPKKGVSVLTIVMTRVIDIIYCSHPFDFDHAFYVAKVRILPWNVNTIWKKWYNLGIHIVPINSKFNWKFVKLTHPLFGTQVKRTMIMESKSLDLEACVVLLSKKWHRQSIIFSVDFFFYNKSQNVTFCDVYQLAFLELNTYSPIWWLQQLISLNLFVLFYFVIFLETISFYYRMQKKRFDPLANKIKRYDHSMTSRAWIFQWYFRDTYITHKTLFITFAIYQKNIPMKVLKEIKRNWMSFYHLAMHIYVSRPAIYMHYKS